MEEKEEPSSSTFNINLLTGDITLPVVSTSMPVLIQNTAIATGTLPESGQMLPPLTPDVPSSSKAHTGKAKPPGKVKVKDALEKNSEEYIRRRQRNNIAVKKSREKSREKSVYTLQKVEQLKLENEQLESKIAILTKELRLLKDLFMEHARGFCAGGNVNLLSPEQLESLLGCKVIRDRNEDGPSSSTAGTSKTADSAQSPSTIQPLINAAEIELMAFKDKGAANVTQASTQNHSAPDQVVIIDNNEGGTSYEAKDS